jgi:glutathione S-transferase
MLSALSDRGIDMTWVAIVVTVALLQFFWFGLQVGRARARFKVPAPATSGNPDFERVFRIQMNTLEQLVLFIPSIWMFARYVTPVLAAALGVVYVIGRFIYSAGYSKAADKRGVGFGISALPVMILLVGSLVGAAISLVRGS